MGERGTSDAKPLNAWIRALANTAPLAREGSVAFPELLDRLADTFGDRPALLSADGDLTYRGLARRANQHARWALSQNILPGDVVCLLMPNCPEYLAIWLGITRVGGVVALLNTNLTGDALAHSINIVLPKHVIADPSLVPAVAEVMPRLAAGIGYWAPASVPGCIFNELGIERYPDDRLGQAERRPLSLGDRALHIYTSGTTGLPKAANISHFRLLEWSYWFAGMMNTGPEDRLYNCLPMYHSTGGVVAIGAMLVNGGSIVIRPTFSASRFWKDIAATGCTVFQYIGELCRYLVNQPPDSSDTEHRLRLCCGNGMRADVWDRFQQRFHIPHILEFYASTEGNVSLYNCEERPGSIGRIPAFLSHRFPVALIRCSETGEPLRSESGFCIRCGPEETGEAIGRIGDGAGSRMTQFDGYTDSAASDAKVLRDVFAKGDAWFRTGDLLRRDAAGFFYFVDRVGDTFRWKGENVSTAQVEEVICACPGVNQAVVYGVSLPLTEGRAGMAAITIDTEFGLSHFREHIASHLPLYAQPLFVRICSNLQATGTFKLSKVQLVRDGCDPAAAGDAIYFNDRTGKEFVKLDAALYATISNGELRL